MTNQVTERIVIEPWDKTPETYEEWKRQTYETIGRQAMGEAIAASVRRRNQLVHLQAIADAARRVVAIWKSGWGIDGHALEGCYPGYRSTEARALIDTVERLEKFEKMEGVNAQA